MIQDLIVLQFIDNIIYLYVNISSRSLCFHGPPRRHVYYIVSFSTSSCCSNDASILVFFGLYLHLVVTWTLAVLPKIYELEAYTLQKELLYFKMTLYRCRIGQREWSPAQGRMLVVSLKRIRRLLFSAVWRKCLLVLCKNSSFTKTFNSLTILRLFWICDLDLKMFSHNIARKQSKLRTCFGKEERFYCRFLVTLLI